MYTVENRHQKGSFILQLVHCKQSEILQGVRVCLFVCFALWIQHPDTCKSAQFSSSLSDLVWLFSVLALSVCGKSLERQVDFIQSYDCELCGFQQKDVNKKTESDSIMFLRKTAIDPSYPNKWERFWKNNKYIVKYWAVTCTYILGTILDNITLPCLFVGNI